MTVLEAAAMAMAGEDGCCSVRGDLGECCMTGNARKVFEAIQNSGGPSLEQIEALARGEILLAVALEDGRTWPKPRVVRKEPDPFVFDGGAA